MISDKMKQLVGQSSVIRAMFEEGKRLADLHGKENVYDFSLGNPSVEPPDAVKQAIIRILETEPQTVLHGYMNNSGFEDVRNTIAGFNNDRFGTAYTGKNIIMTVGAAGALNIAFKSLLNPGDEVIVFAPFFSEYTNYVKNYDGVLVVVPARTEDFQLNLDAFEASITSRTKAVIINTPNNPTGVIYSADTLQKLADVLEAKQKEYGQSIYLLSDEPYRALVYDGVDVPYVTKFYRNTLVAYSYSKSLSLPGERIGYLAVPCEVDCFEDLLTALNVANRILGFVNAPSLIQKVIGACVDVEVDMTDYRKNRDVLYRTLTDLDFQCMKPEGAFYIFPKAKGQDDAAFCERAKQFNLLLVPGRSFGCAGYFRLAYCVSHDMVLRSLPAFEKLAETFR